MHIPQASLKRRRETQIARELQDATRSKRSVTGSRRVRLQQPPDLLIKAMSVEVGQESGSIRTPLDLPSLERYLSQHLPGFKAPCSVTQFKVRPCLPPSRLSAELTGSIQSGQSNPTYLIKDAK